MCTVPLQNAGKAAEELEFAVRERDFKGVIIGTHVNGKNLDDSSLHPFWRAAERLQTVIIIHPFFPMGAERLEAYYLAQVAGYTAETTVAAICLYAGGVLDRFPGLRIVLCHGGGFFPYQIGRLARAREVREDIQRNTRRMARDALKWFYYDSLVFDSRVLEWLVSEVGADHVMLGSDCPFAIGDPNPTRVVLEASLPAEAKEQILSRNALRLFGIDAESSSAAKA